MSDDARTVNAQLQVTPADVDAAATGWLGKVVSGDRTALGRAITVVESSNPSDRLIASRLIEKCLPLSGDSIRIGVTGLPGAGKSTLIDHLGRRIVAAGHRVAVLTIDPSSERTGGSIMGDKTRMRALSQLDSVFIRPSPTRGNPGGVARRTREVTLLCEAAGYDVVIVETVGVGQSELDARHVVDFLMLLLTTGGGDELQGIKRGVMEYADLVIVSKSDGANVEAASETVALLKSVLELLPANEHGWRAPVIATSTREGSGMDEVWKVLERFRLRSEENGTVATKRRAQAVRWMHDAIREEIRARLLDETADDLINRHEELVRSGKVTPVTAACMVIDALLERH